MQGLVTIAAALATLAVLSPVAAGEIRPRPQAPLPRSEQLPDPGGAALRVLSQLMWDAGERALVRRQVTVLDILADRGLDLMWEPASGEAVSGPASGRGRLTWRRPGARSHDAAAVVAEFEGTLAAGRPEGPGRLWHASGASYAGAWANGLMQGEGRLRWADGEEYVGGFRAGRFDGEGRLTLRDGSVFLGRFQRGLRHGPGHAMPAHGRSYTSTWRHGLEVAGERRMLDGPEGLAHLQLVQQSDYDDVRVGVAVNRTYPDGYGPGDIILYDGVSDGGALDVFPDDPGLMASWRGEAPLPFDPRGEDIYSYSEDYHEPASFVFDVENAGLSPLHLVGGYLYVTESVPDLDPMLRLTREPDCRQPTITTFAFQNFGWSQPQAPRIEGGFTTPDGGQLVQPLSGDVGGGWPNAQIDLAGALQNLGVRLDVLGSSDVPCQDSPDYCLAQVRESGLFGSVADAVYVDNAALMADFAGRLDYTWVDAGGQSHAKSSPFLVPIKVGNLPGELDACAEGGGGIDAYPDPFQLQEAGSDYYVPFSIGAAVAQGEVSRWSFQLDAPKSSHHEFQLVVQLADGREVLSRPVRLAYWKPASPWTD